MQINEYQQYASRTMASTGVEICALGLAGESGEVCDLIKKHLGHGHDLDTQSLLKELGDVLWYLAALATAFGISLDDVADANVNKINERYPDGFSSEASRNRKEYQAFLPPAMKAVNRNSDLSFLPNITHPPYA